MFNNRVFGSCSNGEIDFISYSDDYKDGAIQVFDSFYKHEIVSKGLEINLPESKQARDELNNFCFDVAKQGVSIIAREVSTNRVVGFIFNKIQTLPENNERGYFEMFSDKYIKSKNALALMQFMADVDNQCNLFEKYDVNCLFELMFLGVQHEYGRRGIGLHLCKYSMQLANEIRNGCSLNMLRNEEDKKLRPKLISVIFSSNYSQRIGHLLQMDSLLTVPYTEYTFNGKTYAERIGSEHTCSILMAKKLE